MQRGGKFESFWKLLSKNENKEYIQEDFPVHNKHNSLSSANQSSKLIRKITMVYYCFILVQSKELRSENSLINSDKNSEVQTMTFFTIFYFFIFNVFS